MIKYGIDSFVLTAPWSLVVSILMFSGTAIFGFFILNYIKSIKIINKISNFYYQLPILGFLALLLIMYPLILFNIISPYFVKLVALFLISLNFFFIRFYKIILDFVCELRSQQYKIDKIIVILLVFGYFLISLGPITSADSVDYHSSVAINIVNFASYPTQYYWFHSRIAGSGELLIALGLSLGAEQFGSLVQFSGLLSILGLIAKLCKNFFFDRTSVIFFILLFLITPILIFLNSTSKPQLMPIALTSIAYVLVFFHFKYLKKKEKIFSYCFVAVLLIESFLLKYSFVLSSLIIGTYALSQVINKKNYLLIVTFTIIILFVVFAPYSFWKYIHFEKNLFYSLFWALPEHLYGYDSFMQSISSCGYRCYPTWFFIPRSISEATNFFGILFCFFIFLKIKRKNNLIVLFSIIFYITIGLNFGQSNPRFFFEPSVWFLFLLISSSNFFKTTLYKYFFRYIVRLQAVLVIIIIYVSIFSLVPASLFNTSRTEVLNKSANGYALLNWASNVLMPNDVILLTHRSVAIPTIKTIPIFFINYLNPKDKRAQIYFEQIKKEKPNYIIFAGEKMIVENKYKKIFSTCIGEMVFFKKKIHKIATRNPLIIANAEDGFIYRFYSENLPGCLTE